MVIHHITFRERGGPMSGHRNPNSPITRYELANTQKKISAKALKVLFKLHDNNALRMRNERTLTFVFSEAESILTPEESDYLEKTCKVTACRTTSAAGELCNARYSTWKETIASMPKGDSLSQCFISESHLPSFTLHFADFENDEEYLSEYSTSFEYPYDQDSLVCDGCGRGCNECD